MGLHTNAATSTFQKEISRIRLYAEHVRTTLMPFDLNIFKQNLTDYGTSSSNKFDVSFTLPNIMQTLATQGDGQGTDYSFLTTFSTLIPLRAQTVSVPGIGLLMKETNKFGVGPRIKQAYNAAIPDTRVTFLIDENGSVEEFFMLWMNLCYNFSFDDKTNASYLANYRSDIVTNITINKYDNYGQVINTYTLYQAMPTVMSTIELDWNNTDNLIKFNVLFSCTSFTIT
jgi:hypothetical protein